ncbi:MAG: hypothetical protein AB1896_12645 [Thermodesulfobacteriota bacterium]
MSLIKVKLSSYFAVARTGGPSARLDEDGGLTTLVEPGTTVEGLILELDLLGPGVSADDVMIFVFVNGRPQSLDYRLGPGDVVDLHVPVMGG